MHQFSLNMAFYNYRAFCSCLNPGTLSRKAHQMFLEPLCGLFVTVNDTRKAEIYYLR